MKKKIVLFVTIITMFISVTSVMSNAADNTVEKDGFIYLEGTNQIIAYIGNDGICEIPENAEVKTLSNVSANSNPVKKLIINKGVKLPAFYDELNALKEVEFKDGITEIPDNFLEDCSTVESIKLSSTLKQIGDRAFMNCKNLKTVIWADGLESIGEYAFYGAKSLCGNLIMPDTVAYMGDSAFGHCGNLDKVHLSDNLIYTPSKGYNDILSTPDWFIETSVKEINIPDAMLDNPPTLYADEITFNSDMTVNIFKAVRDSDWCNNKYLKGKTEKSMGENKDFAIVEDTVLKYIGDDKKPVVPNGVEEICEYAFAYCDIETVLLPESLEKIDDSAFAYATLKEVTIPANVKIVEDNAFRECQLIEKVTFEGVPTVGDAFGESGFLTRENVIIKNKDIKLSKSFYDFEGVENNLDNYYDILKEHGTVIDNKIITIPKPTVSPEPETTPKPTETPKPAAQTLTVKGGEEIEISVNGKKAEFDVPPFIDDNDRTQIPVRAVAETLDCKVDWNQDTKTAVISKDSQDTVKITLDSDVITVNDKQIKMDTAALLKGDRTFVPVRFIAEALGLTVEWVE